jgi:hypothetical protein
MTLQDKVYFKIDLININSTTSSSVVYKKEDFTEFSYQWQKKVEAQKNLYFQSAQ